MLGVMLFARERVSETMHTVATLLVAGGTTLSAFWILALNSWMQTPAGFEMINGQAHVTSWLAVIFNPSFPYRLTHTVVASYIATALMVAGAAAWHLLRGRDNTRVRTMLSMAMWMLLIAAPVQALIGDHHGLNTMEHQPAKLSAIEGHWEHGVEGEGVPLILFGLPDMAAETRWFRSP